MSETRVADRRLRAFVPLVAFVVLASSSVALAQGSDVVMLANGGRIRGTVEIYEPGQDVVIVLSDGTRRTVPAAEVVQVIFGDAASTPTPPAIDITPVEPSPAPSTSPPTTAPPSSPPITPTPSGAPIPPSRSGPLPDASNGGALPEVQHLGALESIAGVPEGVARTYAPGEPGGEWEDDPATRPLPDGPLHLGVEFRVGPRFAFGSFQAFNVAGDVSVTLDYRLADRVHVRVAALFGISSFYDETRRGTTFGSQIGSSAGTLGARASLGFDAARLFIVRLGLEFGGEYLPTFPRVEPYVGGELVMLGQLLDEGRLEIGLALAALGMHQCSLFADTSNPAGDLSCSMFLNLRPQVLIGGVF